MSIEVLDKQNPETRAIDGGTATIYAYEHTGHRRFMLGDELTDKIAFAYVTERLEFRECKHGLGKQEVAVFDGVVGRGHVPNAHKEVKHRVADDLLPLPFFNLRRKIAGRRNGARVLGSRALKEAIQADNASKPITANNQLAIN